ncbi:hypothetical protein [Caenimonas aquaedulcis]|uniref:Uncharacterized protein n=1 Tax=Caenimonas aquaedulcis TaxID=2793270 RepID=A0A931H730_9BURK|nr:hypothetical protein [Caenimonas aquaedulcis]MBG9389879.1 hypothetical protein [Caenimonas aquaedulcis]
MSITALPSPVAREIGTLVQALAARGLVPVHCEQSESFGNFEVGFVRGPLSFSVVRDRGQFHVDRVEREVLEPVGLWRSFSGVRSLELPLLAWVESHAAV